jgi:hypothetical protein
MPSSWGQSSSNTTQNSTTAPWQPAQGTLQGLLSSLQGQLGSVPLTSAENSALHNSVQNAKNYSATVAPQIGSYATSLLGGGGANNQAGNVNQNYLNYQAQTNPLASNTNYDPMQTPGIGNQLSALTDQITGQVNGSFAAAGRDGSGYNQKALGQGLSAGLAPILTAQYNQNVQNQQGAANNLYNAGNTNAGILSGLQQQYLANQGQGVTASQQGLDAQNAGNNATLQAEAYRRGVPAQQLGLLAQIGVPIAGLGSQSSGQSNTQNQASPAQVFGQVAGGVGSIFGGNGGSTTAQNILKMFSDRRMKEDIAQVGTLFDGTPVYRYRYIGHPAFQIGLMAQDIENITPEAVSMVGQFKAVDYKLATDKVVEAA